MSYNTYCQHSQWHLTPVITNAWFVSSYMVWKNISKAYRSN